MKTQKAGCYLINKDTQKIAIVYRTKHDDYTFPKGHLEPNESIRECAIRETAEETKRIAKICDEFEPIVETYTSSKGENCECFMFIATDEGPSDNTSTDTHDVLWVDINSALNILSYEGLKNSFKNALKNIKKLLN